MWMVRIEHAVPDFGTWKQAFDRDPADRRGSGVRRYRVLRAIDDPNHVMIDLEFASEAEAAAFLRVMEGIWAGPGARVMVGPRARIAELVESGDL